MMGKNTVRLAVQGYKQKHRLRADHLSPCYTTRVSDVCKINIDATHF